MLHFLISNWHTPAITLVFCVLFIFWKSRGGKLLFRSGPKDDGTTKIWKAIFAIVWAFVSVLISIWVTIGCVVWLIIAATAAACGVS